MYLNKFQEELQQQNGNENTVSSYVSDIQKFLEWFQNTYGKSFNGKLLDQDAKEYRSYLLNIKHFKATTVNRKMNALKAFNKFLCALGSGRDVNIEFIDITDPMDREIKVIDRNNYNRLRRAFYEEDDVRDIAIFEVLANTGIRVSELIKLELNDINLTDKNGEKNYSYVKIREGKGERYREVPLNAAAKKALNQYMDKRPKTVSNNLFLGQRGTLTRGTINKVLEKYCKFAEVEIIGPHVLRHTFSTRLIQSGTDPVTVSRLLGHSSVKVTTDFYINTSREDKLKAVECLS